ncbi:unnamed protein product [Arabis nemorensis]|uniref:Splicing factor SF3a60 /Prp9 subunit C-terminal domain-containing protein n=1 Tax=Arabis nemorensis TaxID=586526 RepID=A0A565BH99_9BRAS|nr:unnamed protein product [Arabis nemorensis]
MESKVKKLCNLLYEEYKCETCGNYSYAGKRDFERLFNEWRHQFGLRRTEKLNRITSIKADGNIGPLACSQSTDQETEMKSSNKVPAGVAIPPPDIRSVVKRTEHILSIKDSEAMIFITSFQHKLAKYRAQNQEYPARATTRTQS